MSVAVRSIPVPPERAPDEQARLGGVEPQPDHRHESVARMRDAISREEIEHLAYLSAERRGFAPGFEQADWLEAEARLLDFWFTEQRHLSSLVSQEK